MHNHEIGKGISSNIMFDMLTENSLLNIDGIQAMTFPIIGKAENGKFAASLVGQDKVRAVAAARAEALNILRTESQHLVAEGKLASIKVGANFGVSHPGGDIC